MEGNCGGDAECCMCGDEGIASELFACQNCKFRSQHKYCSNLYPGAESYNICNWCLCQKEDKKGAQNAKTSPNSSHNTTSDHQDDNSITKMKQKKRVLVGNDEDRRRTTGQIKKLQIKLPVAEDRRPAPSSAGRKRVTTSDEKIMRRTRSEEISNGGKGMIIKQVFRNKVRRYKLLDEVSS